MFLYCPSSMMYGNVRSTAIGQHFSAFDFILLNEMKSQQHTDKWTLENLNSARVVMECYCQVEVFGGYDSTVSMLLLSFQVEAPAVIYWIGVRIKTELSARNTKFVSAHSSAYAASSGVLFLLYPAKMKQCILLQSFVMNDFFGHYSKKVGTTL